MIKQAPQMGGYSMNGYAGYQGSTLSEGTGEAQSLFRLTPPSRPYDLAFGYAMTSVWVEADPSLQHIRRCLGALACHHSPAKATPDLVCYGCSIYSDAQAPLRCLGALGGYFPI